MIKANGLCKKFRRIQNAENEKKKIINKNVEFYAVDHVDIEAGKGEIFKATGLIPNMVKGGGTGSKAFEKFRRYPNRIIREFTQKKREPYMIDQL